jgi:hypothetical protein
MLIQTVRDLPRFGLAGRVLACRCDRRWRRVRAAQIDAHCAAPAE